MRTGIGNYRWTVKHALALCDEYTERYKKIHATQEVLEWLKGNEPELPDDMTPFRQAVAEDCKRDDIVLTYQLYYLYYKSYFAKWKTKTPSWFVEAKRLIDDGGQVEDVVSFLEAS